MVAGLVPVTVIAYISSPFVTYIHLRLPIFARQSHEMLLRLLWLPRIFTPTNQIGPLLVVR